MKHFKLNIEHKFIPVADICIDQVPEKDYEKVAKAFGHALIDTHIEFDDIVTDGHQMVARKKELSFSISE